MTLLNLLFLATFAAAESAWIHAVGIDPDSKKLNESTFYQSAVNFDQSCRNLHRQDQCHLLINDNADLHPNAKDYPKKIERVEQREFGSADLKKYIAEKLKNAGPGDTVVISLQDHGSPILNKGASCIYVRAEESICEKDLADILHEYKKPGTKVVINADACFSGAFADLSSKEVCTATTASRLVFENTAQRDFWNAINDRHPKTLSDLREPIIVEAGKQRLLGSQVILQKLCEESRQRLGPQDAMSLISFDDSIGLSDPASCRDQDRTVKKMIGFLNQVNSTLRKTQEKSCAELALPNLVCEARTRLEKAQPDIKKLMDDLAQLRQVEKEKHNWIKENDQFIQGTNKRLEELTSSSQDERREIADSLLLGREPDWNKFDKQRVTALKSLWKKMETYRETMAATRLNQKQSDRIFNELKSKGFYEDLLTMQNCLMENKAQDSDGSLDPLHKFELQKNNLVSMAFTPRTFSEEDYKEARQCENSVSF